MRCLLPVTLVAIILLATFLRAFDLNSTPPGLHYDEAFNAIQARDVLSGANRPIFFTGNFGEEPLQMYLGAVLFGIVGESAWAIRLASAILGILLVPAIWFTARSFFPSNRTVPIISAFIGATLYWGVNFSRIGIETNSLPVFLCLSAGALAMANSVHGNKWPIVAGIFTGITAYTYLASRVWLLVPIVWIFYLLVFRRQTLFRNPGALFQFAVATLVTLAPLGLFFLANPLALTGRSGQVLSPDQFLGNTAKTVGMFFFSGDTDPRNNLPGRPALDPFLAVLFVIGLAVSARRATKPEYAFLILWLVMMTAPSAVTEFAPNFRRSIGAMPAVVLLCGVGADWVLQTAHKRSWSFNTVAFSPAPALAVAFIVVGLGFSMWSSARDYFTIWANQTGLFYSFDAGLLKVAEQLYSRPKQEQLCVSPDYQNHPSVLWALHGRAFSAFDGRFVTLLPNSAQPATCAIITHEDSISLSTRFYSPAQILAKVFDLDQQAYAEIVYLPAGVNSPINPSKMLYARVGEDVQLLGDDLTRAGNQLHVNLYWKAQHTMREDYTVFVHLIGPPNPITDSAIWAQDDSQPGHGTYPTSRWREGQVIIDRYLLSIPSNAPAGGYQIEAGMYILTSGERLPVYTDGRRAPNDRVLLGDVQN